MTILCGTDFSQEGSNAMRVAAQLAARMNVPLHLVHAVALSQTDLVDEATRAELARNHRQRLVDQAEQLKQPGLQVFFHVAEGAPDELLLRFATELSASLVIVGALGQRNRSHWQLGSHADRLAQRSHVPVLVVRNDQLSTWAREERPLRVVLGADLTASTAAAMEWLNGLARFGRVDVTATHLYWPPEEYERLGLRGVRDYIQPVPAVTETLERDLTDHLSKFNKCNLKSLRIEPHLGRIGDRLATIAHEEQADLIVVGSHDRGAARVWEGSISRIVLQQASSSVACVPAPSFAVVTDVPRVRTVLVATDFSPTGNAAIPLAYAVAEPGATIHLVHIVPDPVHNSVAPRDIFPARSLCEKYRETCEQLGNLRPKSAMSRDQKTELHVLESNHAADAICQAAERLGADVICLGTHGRTGLAKVVMGSVANAVMARTHRPLLFARKPAV